MELGVVGVIKNTDNHTKSGQVIRNSEVTEENNRLSKEQVEGCMLSPARGIMYAYIIVLTGACLMIRNKSRFYQCCYEEGGVFHPSFPGRTHLMGGT